MKAMQLTEHRLNKRLKPLQNIPSDQLLIHEIFASIQGESSFAGEQCTFIRIAVCHLRCSYCDTRHAFYKGKAMTLEAIMDEVRRMGNPMVEVTGGEPLLQSGTLELMKQLCDAGYLVLLETSGSLDISVVDKRVIRIIDIKTPSSGEEPANRYENLQHLLPTDELKFVIGSHEDYLWSRDFVQKYDLLKQCKVLFGIVFDTITQENLAQWLIQDRLQVRMQLQMHKYIWSPEQTGV